MADLKSRRVIIFKGFLFLLTGFSAGILLMLETPTVRSAAALGICVWSFCRFYYFAFDVIEKYVDQRFRFAGLISFLLFLWRGPRPENQRPDPIPSPADQVCTDEGN
ncbi:MAG: hypothetical protein KDA96_20955 [Planctomycetaceae bacterium]|nr:hypothetical protein [Planctomycetaceae bacterium]